MLFDIILWLIPIMIVFILAVIIFSDSFEKGAIVTILITTTAIMSVPLVISWNNHANDLAVIYTQDEMINIYTDRVNALENRLSRMEYPKNGVVNRDTPVASIVESLTEAEGQLVKAAEEKVLAVRRIESRRNGVMSNVVDYVGDYK